MAGGDLKKALQLDMVRSTKGKRLLGWYERGRLVLVGVARGLQYLHSERVRLGLLLKESILPSNLISSHLQSTVGCNTKTA